MRKLRLTALCAVVCLVLSGCGSLADGYIHVTPHQENSVIKPEEGIPVANYHQLLSTMKDLVNNATENAILDVERYESGDVEGNTAMAARYIQSMNPIGAYAVEDISFEVGMHNGSPAVALTISYSRSRAEIRQIERLPDQEAMVKAITRALQDHASRLVVLLETYSNLDVDQIVQAYAAENPHILMEIPQVSEGVYGVGASRLVELTFRYQNTREELRNMQQQVGQVFEAAELYVSPDGSDRQKFGQLYSFLMERFDYQVETSITPAYSLLHHGVGDATAFAQVFAAMCRRIGLECRIITGSRNGEPYNWNMICDDGRYFHVDLLRCSREGGFREYTDAQMAGYVWDYSAHPDSVVAEQPSAPTEEASGEGPEATTEPEETESTQQPEPEP